MNKCIYKNENVKQDCKNCDSKACEKNLREKGIYYTTCGFIQYVNKTVCNK
jgi:hypothetical protein